VIIIPPPGGSCDRIGGVEVPPHFPLSRKEVAVEKVLCIDDDLSLLRLYQEELAEEGYKVVLARDGKEGLAKFEKEKPHVVVMDIRMPVMDGIETLTAMLGKDRQVPVILNTAYPQYKENFMTWGAEAYVVKSSDLTELKQKIRDILDRRKKMGSQKE
jgi:two-component system, response regulator, stage 0 sporulation protein F